MSKVKLIIEKVDGVEQATAIVKFDFGKVYPYEIGEDGKKQEIVSSVDVDDIVIFYQNLVYEKALDEDWEGYNEMLEEYVRLKLTQTIGVKTTPLRYDVEGNLEGLDEDVKVVKIDESTHTSIETTEKYYGVSSGIHRMKAHESMETTANYYEAKEDESK